MNYDVVTVIFYPLLLGIGLIGFWRLLNTKHKQVSIELANGHQYSAILGNDLVRFNSGGGTFRGIDVELPKTLPHIFLDSNKNDTTLGQQYYFSQKQRLTLEGDFNTYFQAYVPEGYQILALSILSPDVLQTLLCTSVKYDVEIYGSHLRLISRRRIYKKSARETDLISVAQKILIEIDHRLKSWSVANSHTASKALLTVEDDGMIKVGHKAFRGTSLVFGSLFGALGLLFWYRAFSLFNETTPQHSTRDILVVFTQAFLVLPVLLLYVVVGYSRGWLNWTNAIFSNKSSSNTIIFLSMILMILLLMAAVPS